jgi:GTP-binding protein
LHPNLGVIRTPERDFVLADIPGLIAGAHEGAGLGTRFLGHVERCRVLVHLVDATELDIAGAYRTVRTELKAYGEGLEKKKELVALTKCDALDGATIAAKAAELKTVARKKPFQISAVSGAGIREALAALAREIAKADAKDTERASERDREAVTDTGLPRRWEP